MAQRSLTNNQKSNDITITKCNFKNNMERLSLAYRYINKIPNKLINFLGDSTKTLDLSHNNLTNLSFLSSFPQLHTLILDRNPNLNCDTLPVMKNLTILWLNNCNIINTTEWIYNIQLKCPNLKQLSMMCNPVGYTVLNGVTDSEEQQYRREILSVLPTLEYFDGVAYTKKDRNMKNFKKRTSLMNFTNILNSR